MNVKPKSKPATLSTPIPTDHTSVNIQNWYANLPTGALAISVISGLTYLIAFNYECAYLAFFGGDAQFVELSIERVVYVFSVLISAIVITYPVIDSVTPILKLLKIRSFVTLFVNEITVVVFISIFWLAAGVNWITVGFTFMLLLLVLNHIVGVIRKLLKGAHWKEWFVEWGESAKSDRKKSKDLNDFLIQNFGYWQWAITLSFVFILPVIGTTAGNLAASREQNFKVFSDLNGDYILIGHKGDSWVFSKILENRITGTILLKKIDPSVPLVLNAKVFPKGIEGSGRRVPKPSLPEWWEGVRIFFGHVQSSSNTFGPH